MSTALTPATIKQTVPAMTEEWAKALPSHITPERFARVVQTALLDDSEIRKCDPATVWAAATKCAQDGLLPDKREAAFVKFGQTCQYMPMIGGILKRLRQSGEVKTINVQVVHENDDFLYEQGDTPKLEHRPDPFGDRGEMVGAYAVVTMKDGGVYREVMDRKQIEKVRGVSRARGAGPWTQWESEMWRKTVMRRLSKWLPVSNDVREFLERDDHLYDLNQSQPERRSRVAERYLPKKESAASDDDVIEGEIVEDDDAPDADAASLAAGNARADFLSALEEADAPTAVAEAQEALKASEGWLHMTEEEQAELNKMTAQRVTSFASGGDDGGDEDFPGDKPAGKATPALFDTCMDQLRNAKDLTDLKKQFQGIYNGEWHKFTSPQQDKLTEAKDARKAELEGETEGAES